MRASATRRRGDAAPNGRARGEFVKRAASAIVLAAVALLMTGAGPWPFALLLALGGGAASWEWGRIVRGTTGVDAAFMLHAATVAAAALMATAGRPGLALLIVVLGATAVAPLAWGRRTVALWSVLGVVYLGLPAIAVAVLRSDPVYGALAIYYLFLVTWGADTAAYAAGRLIGGPKLAPRISPGKTWSGFAGGVLVPALVAAALAFWLGGTSPAMIGVVSLGLAVLVQAGDLAESAIKRVHSTKDASGLIPGHGGLLDRVDGFIFAGVAAGSIAVMRDAAAPGAALLIWH